MPSVQGAWLSRPIFRHHGIFMWVFRYVVLVRYSFFVVALLLGARAPGIGEVLIWLVVVSLAILLHELGHALAATRLGAAPTIELNAMGGLTTWSWPRGWASWREQVFTSVAGPGMGFVTGGCVWALARAGTFADQGYWVHVAVNDFLWVSLAWGVFNLFPILPLDGGQALEAVLQRRLGAFRGRRATQTVSAIVGGLVAAYGLLTDQVWLALMCGVLAYNSLMALRGQPGFAPVR